MCYITTSKGIRWEITSLNGRAAYQRNDITILWIPSRQEYVMINKLAQVIYSHPLSDNCLQQTILSIN